MRKNDKELLELAAKAAGYQIHIWGIKGDENVARMDVAGHPRWNPLNDDGDALRLSVALDLDICRPNAKSEFICVWVDHLGDFVQEVMGEDKCIATRRAIVRAAAEIGKAMP